MTSHLTVPDLKERLAALGLPTEGKRVELQKRLRKGLTKIKAAEETQAKLEARGESQRDPAAWRPKYRNFLVTDVEATCEVEDKGGGFGYPNEIIEWPVVLVRLVEPGSQSSDHLPSLQVVDEFTTYVQPKLGKVLTDFCKTLTSVTQDQVDAAPGFQEVVWNLYKWLDSHKLLDAPEGIMPLSEYPLSCKDAWGENAWHPIEQASLRNDTTWVTHGAYDILSFIPKAAWINGLLFGPPKFLRGPILDIRKSVHGFLGKYIPKPRPPRDDRAGTYFGKSGPRKDKGDGVADIAKNTGTAESEARGTESSQSSQTVVAEDGKKQEHVSAPDPGTDKPAQTPAANGTEQTPRPPKENGDGSIPGLLQSMGLGEFQGHLHCGIDDTRNIARILIELGRRAFEGLAEGSDEVLPPPPVSAWRGRAREDEDQEQAADQGSSPTRGALAQPFEKATSEHNNENDAAKPNENHISNADDRSRPSTGSRNITPATSRPVSPPATMIMLLQSLLQPNLAPYEYPPFPPLLNEEERRNMNDPTKTVLSDSDRRLLKGGGRYYPRRYDWMGKKVGTVKWNFQEGRVEKK